MLLFVGATLGISFKNVSYHVVSSSISVLPRNDVHVLSGDAPDQGGDISARSLNNTVQPYTITFGPLDDRFQRTMKTTLQGAGGSSQTVTGAAVCPSTIPDVECFQLNWLTPGSAELIFNPPPPPPKCGDAHTKANCSAVAQGACEWCVSDDKSHALCFDKSNVPASGWKCA